LVSASAASSSPFVGIKLIDRLLPTRFRPGVTIRQGGVREGPSGLNPVDRSASMEDMNSAWLLLDRPPHRAPRREPRCPETAARR
jgi:hypothetical protein